ncbi:MAG TPA: ribonuclease D [Gemmataceae bacterium]
MPHLPEHIIDDPAGLADCCAAIERAAVFGFDTEFVGEDTYHPHLCVVQVATPEARFLIDALAVGPLDPFWKLVIDPSRVTVVHAGREEVRLCHLWGGESPGNLFDVQIAAGLVGLGYPLGHSALVQQALGVRLAKGETLTDWRKRPLTKAQVRYAFDDVRHLLALWEWMDQRLERLGRREWAREEFAALKRRAVVENPAAERWRKLRGLGSLTRRQLAVARELYVWREEEAARANRPARGILRDDLIVEVARRNPTRERELSVLRGLHRSYAEAILAAVRRGREVPAEDCPAQVEREVETPQVALVGTLLGAVLTDFCARNALAPPLVTTSGELKALVRARAAGRAPPKDLHLAHGWRAEFVLPELLAVLEGRRLIRVGDLNSPNPLALTDAAGADTVTG